MFKKIFENIGRVKNWRPHEICMECGQFMCVKGCQGRQYADCNRCGISCMVPHMVQGLCSTCHLVMTMETLQAYNRKPVPEPKKPSSRTFEELDKILGE